MTQLFIAAPILSAEALSWTPSPARTLSLAPLLNQSRPGQRAIYPALQWPTSDGWQTLDYSLDVSPLFADAPDTITRVSASSPCGGPTVISVSWTGSLVTVWLSGGGAISEITVTIITASGRVWSPVVYLQNWP